MWSPEPAVIGMVTCYLEAKMQLTLSLLSLFLCRIAQEDDSRFYTLEFTPVVAGLYALHMTVNGQDLSDASGSLATFPVEVSRLSNTMHLSRQTAASCILQEQTLQA